VRDILLEDGFRLLIERGDAHITAGTTTPKLPLAGSGDWLVTAAGGAPALD